MSGSSAANRATKPRHAVLHNPQEPEPEEEQVQEK